MLKVVLLVTPGAIASKRFNSVEVVQVPRRRERKMGGENHNGCCASLGKLHDRFSAHHLRLPELSWRKVNNLVKKTLVILIALFVTGELAYCQAKQDNPGQAIKLSTDLVVVDAEVLNRGTGRPVGGLGKEDFALYEDGVKQLVTHFSHARLPLSIVLLLDVSPSVLPVISRIQDGGLQALQQLKSEDEVALMAFDVETTVIEPFTRDRQLVATKIKTPDQIIATLNNTRHVEAYGTHIADSIYEAARYLLEASNPAGRRAIIVVTDNQPYEKKVAHSKLEVVNQLLETGTVVYGLVVPPIYEDYTLLKVGRRLPTTWLLLASYNKGGKVNSYSEPTGGVVFKSGKENVQERLAELLRLLRSRYNFGYVSSNLKRDGKFRKIQLKVSPDAEKREGKIAVVTRKGYYAAKDTLR